MDYTFKTFGGINILVNNASIFTNGHIFGEGGSGTFCDFLPTAKQWDEIWRINVMGYIYGIQYAVPYMKKNALTNVIHRDEQGTSRRINAGSRGSIINISSVCGFMAVDEFLPYNVSKAVFYLKLVFYLNKG